MIKNIIIGVLVVTTLLFAGLYLIKEASYGATGTRFPNGISADSTSPVAGQVRGATFTSTGDVTIGGGTLNVTTSNTATSTIVAGCFEFYATSTETAQRFQASTTPGVMYSQYGACPRL
jgi:hypothetical protein